MLVQNLPSNFETKIIPVWTSGLPSVADAVLPVSLYRNALKFRPDLLLTDLPLNQSKHLELMRRLFRLRCAYAIRLWGDIWTEVAFLRRERRASLSKRSPSALSAYMITDFYGRLLNKEMGSANLIIPACRWLEERVHSEIGDVRTDVVYQGVDSSTFYEEKGLQLKHPNVGIVQTYNIWPKVKALIEFRDVMQQMPDVTFYVVAGEPSIRGLAPYFKSVAKALQGVKNVIFIPYLTYPDQVRRFLSACDVYALVSGLDCCPTTILEASLVGRPVVASKVGGVPEIIRHGKTGFCVDNSRPQVWMDIIRDLHRDQKYARTMGFNAREFVMRNFDWSVIAPKVAAIACSEF
jgi:glycosyltransferase involved in cell wall biosynthesis